MTENCCPTVEHEGIVYYNYYKIIGIILVSHDSREFERSMLNKELMVNADCMGVVESEYNDIKVELKQLVNQIHKFLKRQPNLLDRKKLRLVGIMLVGSVHLFKILKMACSINGYI